MLTSSRRQFLQQAATTLATGVATGTPERPGVALTGVTKPGPPVRPNIRTSCVSWCFHGFAAGTDPEPPIDQIGELGFQGIELMVNQEDDLTKLWTDARIARVRQKLAQHKLELVALTPFFPMLNDLGSQNTANARRALDNFERCCQLAQKLGTSRVEIIAPHVHEFTSKTGNLGIPSFMYKLDKAKPGDKIHLETAEGVNWPQIWSRMTSVLRECLRRTHRYKLSLLVEPHYHSIIPDTATFLLMANELRDPSFQLTADTGWGTQQCEYPPMMVHRMQRHLKVLQFRDVDSQTRNFVPFGEGVVDVAAVLDALRAVNYNGYVSFEEVFMKTAQADAVRFLKTMQDALTGTAK